MKVLLMVLGLVCLAHCNTHTVPKRKYYSLSYDFIDSDVDNTEPRCTTTRDEKNILIFTCWYKQQPHEYVKPELATYTDPNRPFKFSCYTCEFTDNNLNSNTLPLENVIELRIYNKNLTTISLETFLKTKYLKLENVGLGSIDASKLPPNLETLKIYYNADFQVIQSRQFESIPKLTKLSLAHNQLRVVEANAFDDLVNLKSLDLSYNYIKVLPRTILYQLKNLESISLAHNSIFSLEPFFFSDTPNITYIDISFNPLFELDYMTLFVKRHMRKRQQTFNINGIPCSTLKHRLLDFLENDFYAKGGDKFTEYEYKRLYEGEAGSQLILKLVTDTNPRLWYEHGREDYKCLDYFGYYWSKRQGLNEITDKFRMTHIVDRLIMAMQMVKRRNVFGCELMAFKEFLLGLNTTIGALESSMQKVPYTNNDLYSVYETSST